MTRNILTNQQLLKELEKRLPEFTPDEFTILTKFFAKYREEFMKVIQVLNPEVHDWTQAKIQEWGQQKNDEKITKLKKSLSDNQ